MRAPSTLAFRLAVFATIAVSISAVCFVVFGPTKAKLQSRYLSGASVGRSITWFDVYTARKTILNEEPTAKCIRVGKDRIDGKDVLDVFTPLQLYQFEEDASGNWKLKHKGAYDY